MDKVKFFFILLFSNKNQLSTNHIRTTHKSLYFLSGLPIVIKTRFAEQNENEENW